MHVQGQTVPLCHRPKPWVVWSSIVPQQLKWTCSPHKNAMCSSFVSCALLLPAICSLTQPMIMASSSTFWCFRGSEGFASVMDVSLKRKQLNWVLSAFPLFSGVPIPASEASSPAFGSLSYSTLVLNACTHTDAVFSNKLVVQSGG